MNTTKLFDDIIFSAITNTDGYKPSHWLQYPPGTEYVEAYIESRGGKFAYTEFYGLQMFLKEYLSKPITQGQIDFAEKLFKVYGAPFNKEGWQYILDAHGGYLPIEIRAVKEGSIIPLSNILVKIINTDPKCFWLPSYVETALLRAVWYPMNVATLSRYIKETIRNHLEATADNTDGINFMLNDFGARGVSSFESAGIGGSAHAINFAGSDTITGGLYAMKYYNLTLEEFPIRTVPAAEHSSITSWQKNRETEAYQNMLNQFGGKYPIIAVVSDSYDIFHAVRDIWGEELKEQVIQCGSMVVIRPDSGDPVDVVTKLALILDSKFGHTINSKGYRVLKNVRIIQGDGIDETMIDNILYGLRGYGFSASNVVFGMGGKLLQGHDRDTQKMAQKTCAIRINGVWYDVYKDPITDQVKKSKRGRLSLYRDKTNGNIFTALDGHDPTLERLLILVFHNGKLLVDYKFTDIQETAEKNAKNINWVS